MNTSPLKYPHNMMVRVDQEFLDKLDDLRTALRPVPTRSEYIRRMVLEAKSERKKVKA